MALNQKTNNIDDEWSSFLSNPSTFDEYYDDINKDEDTNSESDIMGGNIIFTGDAPEPTPIYISTKSKIAYLEEPVDLKLFWDIPVIPYYLPKNGVIKKQIKINSKSPEELVSIQERLQKEIYFEEHVMTHIDNPNGRIKFKDIRKITVGISKKDIMSYRSKKKQAFYNCFVMILRIKFDDTFKEFHIKVFNTGKLEIPGVQNDVMYETVLQNILNILQPHHSYPLSYKQVSDTVLINSNFNCGFFVNREALFDILRNKYSVPAIYDPCSYPGIQCKYYFDKITQQQIMHGKTKSKCKNLQDKIANKILEDTNNANIVEVSFMIFRTGSVLIVGMCDEYVLDKVYAYLTNILKEEFKFICQKIIDNSALEKDKKKKQRKKTINIMTGINMSEENILTSNSKTAITPNITPTNIPDTLNEIEEIIVSKKKNVKKVKKLPNELELIP
jgi:hypothetical protein